MHRNYSTYRPAKRLGNEILGILSSFKTAGCPLSPYVILLYVEILGGFQGVGFVASQ